MSTLMPHFFLTRTSSQQIKIHTTLISLTTTQRAAHSCNQSFFFLFFGCTLAIKASYAVSDQKNQKHYLKQCIFCTVCLWGPLPMITTITINEWLWGLYAREGHFRHKSQICVRVWVFFVSYPNGKAIQGKRFRFRFQRSENCYTCFYFKRCVPTAPGSRKRRILRSYTKIYCAMTGPIVGGVHHHLWMLRMVTVWAS